MSSMMRKLANQLSGAKAARKERHMKAQMAKALAKVVRPEPPENAPAVSVPAAPVPPAE